jgi:S-DNA-T family DNA segregation ATPase FtsK/SpoIIIE
MKEVISLAGSNKQNKRQNSNKGKSASGKRGGNTSKTKKNESIEEEVSYTSEMVIWILCAVMLIVELGNFGLCGFINVISNFFFGVFGVIEYILPVAVAFAAFFLHVNEYKRRAVQKVVFGSCVLLCAGMIGQLVAGMSEFSIGGAYTDGYHNHIGGGVICGGIAYLLHQAVGLVGTYIILMLVMILCIVLFAEVSVIDLLKSVVTSPVTDEEEEDAYEPPVRREKKRAKRQRTEDFQEVVTEDFPENRDEVFTERKKTSVLSSISVLPADYDKGILPSKTVDKLPENEEVHEITMDYELDLPGENMGEFAVSQTPKDAVKAESKTRRKKKVKPNVVPAVLPADTDEKTENTSLGNNPTQPLVAEADAKVSKEKKTTQSNPSADIMTMENKTAAEVKNVSAKVVSTSESDYQFPPLELLHRSKSQTATKEDTIRQNALKLQDVLKSFGVNVTMTNYSCGPSVTRYEMVPEQGVKVSKITGLADDIMMNLAAQSIRIEAPIPGKSAVGIEIPNDTRSGVGFRELIDTEKFIKHPSKIAFAVGKDIEGNVVVEDIAKMPHLLIAGATGSGKSVCTNTLIMSILYKAHPDEVKLILVDPKQVELKVYNGIPHLLTPVVTDPKKAAGALNWAVAEMTKRYQMFSECNVRNIQGYNAKLKEIQESGEVPEEQQTLEKMPQIVIIVDELADLMMVAKAEVEEAIVRLAQLARAAGIHLVIATQRPSVDVVTGLIKANVPSRIALSVSSGVDSRTIIDSVGAEKLLGNGDMLFYPTMYPKPLRVQGAYISDDEVMNVVEFLKAQNGETTYNEEVTNQITSSENSGATAINGSADSDRDEYFVQAGKFIIDKDKASIGMLQRMFKIGFNRAARIMDQLFEAGVVGPEEGTKPRQVLMSAEQFEEYVDEYF